MPQRHFWLDDIRASPPGWDWARSYENAIQILKDNSYRRMSLDYDLGWCEECLSMMDPANPIVLTCPHAKNGYDVVIWIIENQAWPSLSLNIHSINPVGRQRMIDALCRATPIPNCTITAEPYKGR